MNDNIVKGIQKSDRLLYIRLFKFNITKEATGAR